MGKVHSKPFGLKVPRSKNPEKYFQPAVIRQYDTPTSNIMLSQESSVDWKIYDKNHLIYDNGRKYLDPKIIMNFFPIDDDDESDRLHQTHWLYKLVWDDTNFSAPVETILRRNGAKCLDVGCGNGVWLMEMATEYSGCKFWGVDVAPSYPSQIKPRNVEFLLANVLEGLPFEDNSFDFVFMRFMSFSFTEANWQKAIKELLRVAKPNGWVELMECDVNWHNEGPITKKFRTAMTQDLSKKFSINLCTSHFLPQLVARAGFTHHFSAERRVPIGNWGGKIGMTNINCVKREMLNLKFTLGSLGDEKMYDTWLGEMLDEINGSEDIYEISFRYWGQKPANTYVISDGEA